MPQNTGLRYSPDLLRGESEEHHHDSMLTLGTARCVYSVSDSTVLQLVIVANGGTVAVELLALYT